MKIINLTCMRMPTLTLIIVRQEKNWGDVSVSGKIFAIEAYIVFFIAHFCWMYYMKHNYYSSSVCIGSIDKWSFVCTFNWVLYEKVRITDHMKYIGISLLIVFCPLLACLWKSVKFKRTIWYTFFRYNLHSNVRCVLLP